MTVNDCKALREERLLLAASKLIALCHSDRTLSPKHRPLPLKPHQTAIASSLRCSDRTPDSMRSHPFLNAIALHRNHAPSP
ncbi:MAG: hypothetical protein AB1589_00285 [Cyanobacteriota bacterium]